MSDLKVFINKIEAINLNDEEINLIIKQAKLLNEVEINLKKLEEKILNIPGKKLIKAIKFFLVILFVSSAFVWLTNNPAIITVNWNNYLIRTNSFGFVLFIFFLIVSIIFTLFVIRKVRDFPRELRISKQSKNIKLANKSLDSLAHNLFTGNIVELKKDSRKIKKYLNNSFFSNFFVISVCFS